MLRLWLRSKRPAPAGYLLAAVLLCAALFWLLHPAAPPPKQQQQQQKQKQQQKPEQQKSGQISDLVKAVRQRLQRQEGRQPGQQELLQAVQQQLGKQQLGLEIKDLEKPGSRPSGVSRQQLLRLPPPAERVRPRALLRPNFGHCTADRRPLFVVLVHTRAAEIAYRNAIRETWHSPARSHTKHLRARPHLWKVVFTTGAGVGDNLQREILEESKAHGDILQFAFVDAPHEATRKTIGALEHLASDAFLAACPPQFVLKVTDDTFVNMPAFVHWLEAKYPAGGGGRRYVGHSVHADTPDRNAARGSYVPAEAYPYSLLPDYNRNPAYLFSWQLVPSLVAEAGRVAPIVVDDAFVGILMARLGVAPEFNDHFVMLQVPGDVCTHLRMFFISGLPPVKVLDVFERNSRGRHLNECKDVLPYHVADL